MERTSQKLCLSLNALVLIISVFYVREKNTSMLIGLAYDTTASSIFFHKDGYMSMYEHTLMQMPG